MPAALKGAAGFSDLADLLAPVAGENYPYCRGKFMTGARAGTEVVPARRLTDAKSFSRIIDRYEASYSGADRRAVVSMWTMHYFSSLAIGSSVCWLELRRILPLELDSVHVCLDPLTGEPRTFLLDHFGTVAPERDIFAAMAGVLRDHAALLIESIAACAGVSPKLLWSNIAGYLAWIVREVGARTDPALALEGLSLIEQPVWPDGWRNPLAGMIRRECSDNGEAFDRLRVCCLRYCLPGMAGCGRICPLPQGRD